MQPAASTMCALAAIAALLVCFHVTDGINPKVNCTATSKEGSADLMCKISSHMDVVQVTWQKRKGNSYETLVAHSKKSGVKISNSYENRLSVLQTEDLGTSHIALSQLEKEDDVCFTAIFNVYPNGALKGEICLSKLRGVREVICKSPASFNLTLDPPQIKTRHLEPNGTTIQIGRWLNNTISPVCKFQLQKMRREKRNVQDGEEVFTIECNTSGTQIPTITWNNEGQPISREEKVNKTGDLITVTSTLLLSMPSMLEHEEISCSISFNKDKEVKSVQEEDLYHEKNLDLAFVRSISHFVFGFLVVISFVGVCLFLTNKKESNCLKKEDKAEKGSLTPLNRKEPHTSVTNGTPRSETKQRNTSSQEKNNKSVKRLFD
ncbi:uncharacterized protein [Eleutherodactylus coqui]|uniref:uncharacterized protein isoform X2 n=1 Tax=Eleutherodactylus coqui TaxID=57060 RepID=UPI00346327BE